MRKIKKSLMACLIAVFALTLGAGFASMSKAKEAKAAVPTSYATVETSMMAQIQQVYNEAGRFNLAITMPDLDTVSVEAGEYRLDTAALETDLPTILRNLGLYDHVKVAGKTLSEYGDATCYDNFVKINKGGPANYTITFPLQVNKDAWMAAVNSGDVTFTKYVDGAFAVPMCSVEILEGALIPGYDYLMLGANPTVYKAGCDFVTEGGTYAYDLHTTAKTDVVSVTVAQDNGGVDCYFGVNLKGDDYAGSTLEVNQNYAYNYVDKISVNGNGVTGVTGKYGLYSLGKGAGHYAFILNVPTATIESITIPAGTLFPSRAMTTLKAANSNNSVTIFYETQEDKTFVKDESGNWYCPADVEEIAVEVTMSKTEGGSDTDYFVHFELSENDYAGLNTYAGNTVKARDYFANSNIKSHVLINGEAFPNVVGETFLNVWGVQNVFSTRALVGGVGLNASEINSITILAGCKFPSYELLEKGTTKYYVTTKDVTFVRNADGAFEKEVAFDLDAYKAEKIAELEAYKAGEVEDEAQRLSLVTSATTMISRAADKDKVDTVVANIKGKIDALPLKEVEPDISEILNPLKEAAKVELDAYLASDLSDLQVIDRNAAVANGKAIIDAATTEAGVADALVEAKALVEAAINRVANYVDVLAVVKVSECKKVNGNFYVQIVFAEVDAVSGEHTYNVKVGDVLEAFGLWDNIYVGDKSLKEWGVTGGWDADNVIGYNCSEPNNNVYIRCHSEDWKASDVEFTHGIVNNYEMTIKEGTLIPSQAYFTGEDTYDVYRVKIETSSVDDEIAYSFKAHAETDVVDVKLAQDNGDSVYLAVGLSNNDYPSEGGLVEAADLYYGDEFNKTAYWVNVKVNGATGIGKYAIYNLNEGGKGRIALTVGMPYDSINSITIPAGTIFPTYALQTLRPLNNNNVLVVVLKTTKDVTFVKTEDGTWVNVDAHRADALIALENAKNSKVESDYFASDFQALADAYENAKATIETSSSIASIDNALANGIAALDAVATKVGVLTAAKEEIASYKAGMFREAEEATRLEYVAMANDAIDACENEEEVVATLDYVKSKIDELKTAAQYADEELADLKASAREEIANYLDVNNYYADEQAEIAEAVEFGYGLVASATNEDEIAKAVVDAKAVLDEILTKEEVVAKVKADLEAYKAENVFRAEEQATRDAIVAEALIALEGLTDKAEIDAIVANAIAQVDALTTADEYLEAELAGLKAEAKAEIEAYLADGNYLDAQIADRNAVIENALDALASAKSAEAIAQIVAEAKAEIEAIAASVTVVDVPMMVKISDINAAGGNMNMFVIIPGLDLPERTGDGIAFDDFNQAQLAALFEDFGLFDKVYINGRSLRDWGFVGFWNDSVGFNCDAPNPAIYLHMHTDNPEYAEAVANGEITFTSYAGTNALVIPQSPITVEQGLIIPGYKYLAGEENAVVYRAVADFVTAGEFRPYDLEANAYTSVDSVAYVQEDRNPDTGDFIGGYFGISLEGDDYPAFEGDPIVVAEYIRNYVNYETILINGEPGLVNRYALYNLGTNGKGRISFAVAISEEDMQSITIPAGTIFPAYASNVLPEINGGNGVFFFYRTTEEITFVKTADGAWVKFADYVEMAKTTLEELKAEKLVVDCFEADLLFIETTVADALAIIDAATTVAEVEAALTNAVNAIEVIGAKADVIANAKADVDAYKAGLFREAEEAQRADIISTANLAIESATSSDEVATIVADAKAAIDALKTANEYAKEEIAEDVATAKTDLDAYMAEEGLYRDEEAEARLAIIESAKLALDEALSADEVATIVADAKAAIDALKTDAEYEAEEFIAMVRADAISQINAIKASIDLDLYDDDAILAISNLYNAAKQAIEASTSEDEIAEIVAEFEADINAIEQKGEESESESEVESEIESEVESESKIEESNPESDEDEESTVSTGCLGNIGGLSSVFALLSVMAAAVVLRKKR